MFYCDLELDDCRLTEPTAGSDDREPLVVDWDELERSRWQQRLDG